MFSFFACVIVQAVHSTLSNSSANHLRPPLLSVRWSANDPMARRSIGKLEYAKRVLMFGIVQPLPLSSRPFDVAFNLHNAVWVANWVERILQRRTLLLESTCQGWVKFQNKIGERKVLLMLGEISRSLCHSLRKVQKGWIVLGLQLIYYHYWFICCICIVVIIYLIHKM